MFERVLNTPLDLTNKRESLESIYPMIFLGGTALNISIIMCAGEFELVWIYNLTSSTWFDKWKTYVMCISWIIAAPELILEVHYHQFYFSSYNTLQTGQGWFYTSRSMRDHQNELPWKIKISVLSRKSGLLAMAKL